jgi:hypothetical protein
VEVFPAASLAVAEIVCAPLLAEALFQESVYGADVSAEPRLEPSSRNCTLVTPTLSVAFAKMIAVPVNVAPLAGEVIKTVGRVVSAALGVTNVKSPLVDCTPLEFVECTRK